MLGFLVVWMLFLGVAAPVNAEPDIWVNVPIFSEYRPASMEVTAREARLIVQLPTGDTLRTFGAGERVSLKAERGRVRISWKRGQAVASKVILRGEGEHPVRVRIRGENGKMLDRGYRGYLQVYVPSVRLQQLNIVNQVALEDYVASVIPAEYPFEDVEGAKAQAVVARTYAVYFIRTMGEQILIPDHVGAQVYQGVDRETPLSRRVTRETRGEILTYNGEPIEAVFSSTCGGHTADNETVWEGPAKPYLRGRVCKYDRGSPHSNWSFKVGRSTLLKALSARVGYQVEGIYFKDRGKDGRFQTVELVHRGRRRAVQGNWFRLAVAETFGSRSLRSMHFKVRLRRGYYYFEGHGFGHGVGFCQWGAHGMAEAGKRYREILTHYYRGVRLQHIRDVFRTPEVEPVVAIPEAFYHEAEARPGWD